MSTGTETEEKSIEFFGAIDKSKDGTKITSEYPAYTFPQQIENAKEGLAQKTRALQSGSVDRESEGEYRFLIEREELQLQEIEKSRPVLSDVQLDLCALCYKDLSKGIKDSMPTLYDIQRNFVDAHEENRRNSKPCIEVNAKTAGLAHGNGIRVSEGRKMSRKDASKLWKIIGHVIGQNTNVERLRKEGFSKAGRPRN